MSKLKKRIKRRGTNVVLREYNKNKEIINEAYERAYPDIGVEYANKPKSAYQWFKRNALAQEVEYEVKGYSKRKIIYSTKGLSKREQKRRTQEVLRSELVKSREQRSKENLRAAFRRESDEMHHLRMSLGWNKKIDWDKVQYHKGSRSEESYFYFEDASGGIAVAFRFGEYYKNTRNLQILNLTSEGEVERVISPYEYR